MHFAEKGEAKVNRTFWHNVLNVLESGLGNGFGSGLLSFGKKAIKSGGIGAGKKVVDSFSDDLVKGVNKNVGRENCELCAEAVDARLKGNSGAVAGGDDAANIFGVNTRLADKFGSPEVTTTTFADITQTIDNLGNGTTGIVTASGNPGHAFNIARLDGKVKILDGQTGDVISTDQFRGFLSQFGNSTFRLFNTTGK